MKKKLLSALLCTALIATSLTACGEVTMNQTKDSVSVEYGDDFQFDVNDYFELSNKKAIEDADVLVDASQVKTDEIGEYDVTVTFHKDEEDEQTFTVKVSVTDTVAPVMKANEEAYPDGYIWLNDLNADFSNYVEVDDLSKTTLHAEYEMLGEVEVVSEEVIAKYQKMLETNEEEGTEETSEATEEVEVSTEADNEDLEVAEREDAEGYYKYTVYAEDEGHNVSEELVFLVVFDKTAPVVSLDGKVLEGESGTLTSADGNLTATDNFLGEMDAESIVKNENEDGTIGITCGDKAGNTYESVWEINAKNGESVSSGNNNGNAGGDTAGATTSNNNAGGLRVYDPDVDAYMTVTNGRITYDDGTYLDVGEDRATGGWSDFQIHLASHKNQISIFNGQLVACYETNEARDNAILDYCLNTLGLSVYDITYQPYASSARGCYASDGTSWSVGEGFEVQIESDVYYNNDGVEEGYDERIIYDINPDGSLTPDHPAENMISCTPYTK